MKGKKYISKYPAKDKTVNKKPLSKTMPKPKFPVNLDTRIPSDNTSSYNISVNPQRYEDKLMEILDPTGVTNYPDLFSAIEEKRYNDLPIEILGSLPIVGKFGKGINMLKSSRNVPYGKFLPQLDNVNEMAQYQNGGIYKEMFPNIPGVYIADKRKIRATTGKPIKPTRDLLSGYYRQDVIDSLARTAIENGVNPYRAISQGLSETNLGFTDENIGHTLYGKNISPYQDMMSAIKEGNAEAAKRGKKTEEEIIQGYNRYGKLFPSTEADYHGFNSEAFYGVPIPKEGLDMNKNPLYGKNILDIQENVIKKSPKVQNIVSKYQLPKPNQSEIEKMVGNKWKRFPSQFKKGGVIKDNRGQWAHPGEITEIGSNNITMQGVPYPVLGVSDQGDTQMMYPEQDYQFRGNKVTEYPMMQKGGTFLTVGGEYHKIYKNADGDIIVNHPKEDKGKWDTINLTDKSNAKTVAQGVAATKKWHKENPYADGGILEENTNMEYGKGGYTVKRSSDRKGKTHVVIGPDGTKKYFGDPNLGERGKSKYGKEAFYARHKKNLDANPYFRAYARATWEDGGMIPEQGHISMNKRSLFKYGGLTVTDLNKYEDAGEIKPSSTGAKVGAGIAAATGPLGTATVGVLNVMDKATTDEYGAPKSGVKGYANRMNPLSNVNRIMEGKDVGRSLLGITGLGAISEATGLSKAIFGESDYDKDARERKFQEENTKLSRSMNTTVNWGSPEINTSQEMQFAQGGMVLDYNDPNANAELELQETFQMPNGQVGMVDGPSHENGGIAVDLPEGTRIWSDKLKYGGKTFAKHTKPITSKIARLEKEIEKAPINSEAKQNSVMLLNQQLDHYFDVQETNKEANEMKRTFKNGGMIKRADGSYSRRGLWDNIRANKGSGKKPTPQMLEQERKIKAKMEMGGYISEYQTGGTTPKPKPKPKPQPPQTNYGFEKYYNRPDLFEKDSIDYSNLDDFKQYLLMRTGTPKLPEAKIYSDSSNWYSDEVNKILRNNPDAYKDPTLRPILKNYEDRGYQNTMKNNSLQGPYSEAFNKLPLGARYRMILGRPMPEIPQNKYGGMVEYQMGGRRLNLETPNSNMEQRWIKPEDNTPQSVNSFLYPVEPDFDMNNIPEELYGNYGQSLPRPLMVTARSMNQRMGTPPTMPPIERATGRYGEFVRPQVTSPGTGVYNPDYKEFNPFNKNEGARFSTPYAMDYETDPNIPKGLSPEEAAKAGMDNLGFTQPAAPGFFNKAGQFIQNNPGLIGQLGSAALSAGIQSARVNKLARPKTLNDIRLSDKVINPNLVDYSAERQAYNRMGLNAMDQAQRGFGSSAAAQAFKNKARLNTLEGTGKSYQSQENVNAQIRNAANNARQEAAIREAMMNSDISKYNLENVYGYDTMTTAQKNAITAMLANTAGQTFGKQSDYKNQLAQANIMANMSDRTVLRDTIRGNKELADAMLKAGKIDQNMYNDALGIKAYGGIMQRSFRNGGTNNPGFKALPEAVQQNILNNMGMGGYMYSLGGRLMNDPMFAEGGKLPKNVLKSRLEAHMSPEEVNSYLNEYAKGGIHIKPENKGKFTAYAKSHGKGVQEMASHIMANKEDYSPKIVKRANFAKNAKKFKH